MRAVRILACILLLVFGFLFFTKQTYAQSSNYPNSTNTNSFAAPQMDANVPRNQHTFTQAITIEVLSAMICQLSGIDPINPSVSCLGINPVTRQLGYAQQSQSQPRIGGLIGASTDLIAMTYRPITSTGVYTQYLSDNFGIVKKVHAQSAGYGFAGLKPVFNLWVAVRNISYGLLVLAFAFIGVGIMLRIKIDPRTVMSIQNQIPRVIIAIILITFSYAISALMIDLMWTTTYAGISILSDNANTKKGAESLEKKANKDLISNPLSFANQIFESPKPGIFHITEGVSDNIGQLLRNLVEELFGVDEKSKCFDIQIGWSPKIEFNAGACVAGFVAVIASIVLKLVIIVILVVTLLRIWFMLLKAYVYTILYVIVAPLFIVFGLLPSKPLGFEKWLRALFANIAVFPLTAFLIVGAKLLMDAYNTNTSELFVPPLVGNSAGVNFGALLAFGALLIGPSLQKILQDKLGVKGVGSPGLISAGAAAGAAVVGAPVGRAMKHLNRTDSQGRALGALARFKKQAGDTSLGIASKGGKLNPFGKTAERVKGRRDAIHNRDYHVSEAQARANYENPNSDRYYDTDATTGARTRNAVPLPPTGWRPWRRRNRRTTP